MLKASNLGDNQLTRTNDSKQFSSGELNIGGRKQTKEILASEDEC